MKKLLLCLLVLVLSLALFACGAENDDTLPPDTDPGVISGDHIHSYIETVTVQPTCTSLGKSVKQCSCGEIEEGSEMPLPFAVHDANAVTCTEDSVCKTCGKVLSEKYGHNFVEKVISVASCTATGETTSVCSRCGTQGETVVTPAGHTFDFENLVIANGTVSAKCTKCGENSVLTAQAPILELTFDDASELDNRSGVIKNVSKPAGITYTDGACQPGGALWLQYSPELVTSLPQFMISFDFKLVNEGRTDKGESLFSFVAAPASGSTSYNWIVKYYEADGTLSTSSSASDHNSNNSVSATLGKWYNCVAIVDTVSNQINIYIDGVSIGSRPLPNHSSADGKYQFRFYDMMPTNGTSNPLFDNFKLVEIK